MNGRIYDAKLGRFLQADPFIQAPYNTQSHNRYSYTLNNPLNATDPDGFFFKKLFKIVVAAVITYVTWGAASAWAAGTTWGAAGGGLSVAGGMAAGAMAGAAGGFASGLMATGSLSGAISGAAWGALAGAAFGGIGAHFGEGLSVGKLAASGLAGGIVGDLQGGKFGHGFISGGIGTLAGGAKFAGSATTQTIKRVVTAAVAGGTVSKLTGEKFANGATSAAFAAVISEAVRRSAQFSDGTISDDPIVANEEFYEDLNNLNDRVANLGEFDTKQGALDWLHKNAHSLSVSHDIELAANVYEDGSSFHIANVVSDGRAHGVSLNTVLSSRIDGMDWRASWHSHADNPTPFFNTFDREAFSTINRYYPKVTHHISSQAWNGRDNVLCTYRGPASC